MTARPGVPPSTCAALFGLPFALTRSAAGARGPVTPPVAAGVAPPGVLGMAAILVGLRRVLRGADSRGPPGGTKAPHIGPKGY